MKNSFLAGFLAVVITVIIVLLFVIAIEYFVIQPKYKQVEKLIKNK